MTVYVDSLHKYESGLWCHLWADSVDELEIFARNLYLKKEWRQLSVASDGMTFIHYDLRKSKRILALKNGAVEKSLSVWLKEKRKEKFTSPADEVKILFEANLL